MSNLPDDWSLSAPPPLAERRLHPRRRDAIGYSVTMPVVVNAEVLDISAGGALISTPAELVPGQRCVLHTLLDREPFSASVDVLRVEAGTRGVEPRQRVGVAFVSLDENSRRTLQRFVRADARTR